MRGERGLEERDWIFEVRTFKACILRVSELGQQSMIWSQRCKSNSPGFNGFGKYSQCFRQSISSLWQCLPWRKKVSEVSSSVQSENCTHKIIIKFIIPYKLYTESFTYHTTQFVIHTCLELQKASFTSSAEISRFSAKFVQFSAIFSSSLNAQVMKKTLEKYHLHSL